MRVALVSIPLPFIFMRIRWAGLLLSSERKYTAMGCPISLHLTGRMTCDLVHSTGLPGYAYPFNGQVSEIGVRGSGGGISRYGAVESRANEAGQRGANVKRSVRRHAFTIFVLNAVPL